MWKTLSSYFPSLSTEWEENNHRMTSANFNSKLQMELVGATDGLAYVLTSKKLAKFLDGGQQNIDLINRVASIDLRHLPIAQRSGIQEGSDALRRMNALCSFRFVDQGDSVFHAGEMGNSLIFVLDGVLQPATHGTVAAPLPFSNTQGQNSHWNQLSTLTNYASNEMQGMPDSDDELRLGERRRSRGGAGFLLVSLLLP